MRVAVHAKVLSERELHGTGVYAFHLLEALARVDAETEYALYSNAPLVHTIADARFREHRLRFPGSWTYLRWPLEFLGRRYDVVFTPKEVTPPFVKTPKVITVHDLMGLTFGDRLPADARLHYRLAIKWHIPRADAVLTISENTRREVIAACRIDPARVVATPLGVDHSVFTVVPREPVDATRASYRLHRPYFINTGSVLWHRKNLLRLVRAFAACVRELHLDHDLVITGKPGDVRDELRELVQSLGLSDRVHLPGFVPRSNLPVLLSGAEALVFPSLHEGFGLPVVEAMACGCPVITSNVSALPEVAGDAALLVSPLDVGAIASAMGQVASDTALRARLTEQGLRRAREFTWERTARQTLDVFRRVAGR